MRSSWGLSTESAGGCARPDRIRRTVVLRLRFDDFSRATCSHTLPHATAHTETVLETVRWLFAPAQPLVAERGLTLVGLAVANLRCDRPCNRRCRSTRTPASRSTRRSTRPASGSETG